MLHLSISLRALVFVLLLAAVALTGSDVAKGAPSLADQTVDGNLLFANPGAGGARDIHTIGNAGGLRIYNQDPALTVNPTGAALQFFANNSNFPGQAFIDSGAHNNAAVIFRTAGTGGQVTERMRVTSTGNVGIGYDDPTYPLELTTATNKIGFVHTDGTVFLSTQVGPGQSGATRGWLGPLSNHPLTLITNNTARMTIDSDGEVGIGTLTPGSTLDVNGTINGGTITGTGVNSLNVSSTSHLFLNAGGSGRIALRTGTSTERMTILDDGKVGIRNTTPAADVDIRGSTSGTLAPTLDMYNSVGGRLFSVLDNGSVFIGNFTTPGPSHVCTSSWVAVFWVAAPRRRSTSQPSMPDQGFPRQPTW